MTDRLLDSGAFSVWKKGDVIELQDYIDYAMSVREAVFEVVALDVIPGRRGMITSAAGIEEAAQQSFKNTMEMRRQGLEAIPVFHVGERWYHLERYLKEGFEYIGLGTRKTDATEDRIAWCRRCFQYICGGAPYPKVKIHGFGEGNWMSINALPWYSTDSTSWIMAGGMGRVYVPRPSEDGKGFDYLKWDAIHVSNPPKGGRVTRGATKQGGSLRTMSQARRQHVLRYFDSIGFRYDAIRDDWAIRYMANLEAYLTLVEHWQRPQVKPQAGFFTPTTEGFGTETWRWRDDYRMFFVASCISHSGLMNNYRHRNLAELWSYVTVGGSSMDFFRYADDPEKFAGTKYRKRWKAGRLKRGQSNLTLIETSNAVLS